MKLELAIKDRQAELELLEKHEHFVKVRVDDKTFDLDVVMVEPGVYSILYKNKSYNVEITKGNKPKQYTINTLYNDVDIDIIDAEARYLMSRGNGSMGDQDNFISSPMPGKVVKILVNVGDKVKEGTTVVIISAMKMESEYKVKQDRIVKEIRVSEGDTIDSNQPLIIFE